MPFIKTQPRPDTKYFVYWWIHLGVTEVATPPWEYIWTNKVIYFIPLELFEKHVIIFLFNFKYYLMYVYFQLLYPQEESRYVHH